MLGIGKSGAAGSGNSNTAAVTLAISAGSGVYLEAVAGGFNGAISIDDGGKGNTITPITLPATPGQGYSITTKGWYIQNAIGGSTTFTATSAGNTPSIFAAEITGSNVQYDGIISAADTTTPYQGGAITGSKDGCALVSTITNNTTGSGMDMHAVTGGSTLRAQVSDINNYYVGAIGSLTIGVAQALNPAWTSNQGPDSAIVSNVMFKETAGVQFVVVGITKQFYTTTDAWSPLTLTAALGATTRMLITLGAWWDSANGNIGPTPLPTDNNGTFVAGYNPTTPNYEEPCRAQIAYQNNATGSHTITPPFLNDSGDGAMVVLAVEGLATSNPVRDTGWAYTRHAPYSGSPDPATIQTLTINSTGSSAQPGDVAYIAMMMDPNTVANSNVKIIAPDGWTVVGENQNATDNIGCMFVTKVVDTAGVQSATFTWTDPDTFIATASMVIFKSAAAASDPPPVDSIDFFAVL